MLRVRLHRRLGAPLRRRVPPGLGWPSRSCSSSQSFARTRATKRFGEPALVAKLESWDSGRDGRSRGGCSSSRSRFAFLALARPQFGHGTRLIPATNLDVVIVLDYSKSMYARDIAPSRIQRAKAEVGAPDPRSPGRALRRGRVRRRADALPAHERRRRDRAVLPVSSTRTTCPSAARRRRARSRRARELFARDPKSKDHVRVIVLVTDGEDLEGDPVQVAEACAEEGTRIDVVQIGGRAPEVDPGGRRRTGRSSGFRKDEEGKLIRPSSAPRGRRSSRRSPADRRDTSSAPSTGRPGIDKSRASWPA